MTYKWTEMTPRERDALVAEKVFGNKVSWFSLHVNSLGYEENLPDKDGDCPMQLMLADGEWSTIPKYTTDISAAWEVMEKMRKSGCLVSVHNVFGGYRSTVVPHEHDAFWGDAPTAPEAICLAALRAVGVDVDEYPTVKSD